MRRATHDVDFVVEYGKVIGINLGWDFCGQHQRRIKKLNEDFGIHLEREYGFEDRRNSIVPKNLVHLKKGGDGVLLYDPLLNTRDRKELNRMLRRDLPHTIEREPIVSAWDDGSFGVRVEGKYNGFLESLYDAFQMNNGVIVTIKDKNPFTRDGLTLLDYRLIPEPIKASFKEADREYYESKA